MAASLSPSQRREGFKEEFLTCSICAEPYDNGEHRAKCLPCLHTYCKSCLQQHAGKRTKFNCPNCRREITLPGGTIESLPNNFIVENLKEYQDIFNLAVPCGSCDEKNQAVSFCHDCGCFLCQDCEGAHRKLSPLRKHKRTTMADLQEKKYNPLTQQQHCKKHPKQDLTMYCRAADCKVPVCATCGLTDHRGHDLIELAAAIDEIVASMRQSAAQLNKRNQELTRRRTVFETAQKTLTDSFSQKEKEMQESEQKLHNLIKSQYSKAHSHLKHLYQTEMNHLSTGIESVDSLAAQMTSACEFANKACEMHESHPTQLLTSHNQIIDRLHELENTAELPETTSDKTAFAFTTKHQSALEQIKKSLQNLCDITWLDQTPKPSRRKDMQTTKVEGEILDAQPSRPATLLPQGKPCIDPMHCTIQFEIGYDQRWPGMREICRATVQAVDCNGQLITTGSGAKIEAMKEVGYSTGRCRGVHVTDNHNGTYTFEVPRSFDQPQFPPQFPRVFVKINGTPMKGSPFTYPYPVHEVSE